MFDMPKCFATFRSFLEYQNTFKFFKNPEFFLNLSLSARDEMLVNTHFRADSFNYPEANVSAGTTQAFTQLSLKGGQLPNLSGPIYAVLDSVSWGESFKAKRGVLHTALSLPLTAWVFPEYVTGVFHEAEGFGHQADTLQCDFDLKDRPLVMTTFSGVQDKQWVKGKVPINIETRALASTMELEGRLNSEVWEALFPVISETGKFPIHFGKAPFCRGQVTLDNDFNLESAALSVVSDSTRMSKVELKSLYADIEITPKDFKVSQAMLRGVDTEIEGSYYQDIESQDYRFLLEGFTKPERLDPWLGAWWPQFWDNYELAYPLPHVSIDLQGNWVQTHRGNAHCRRHRRKL